MRLALLAFQAFEKRLMEALHAKGFTDITPSDLEFLRCVDGGIGTRLVDVAQRSGVSKQRVGVAAQGLAKRGYIAMGPCPEDARSRRARFTPSGEALIRYAIQHILVWENAYGSFLTFADIGVVRGALQKIWAYHVENETL